MRVAIYTLGCKVNQFESAVLSEQFEDMGASMVSCKEAADIYLVNTCAVTSKAAYQARQFMRSTRRKFPGSRIIATGCYVQVGSQEILESVGHEICMAGNDQKGALVEMAMIHEDCMEVYVGDISRQRRITPFLLNRPPSRTRAFIRIQDGCDSYCTYCIVPFARGKSRSLDPDIVRRQVAILHEKGIREIVITGIHVGAYGQDLDEGTSLLGLLKGLCQGFPGMRFRLSSIEPTEISRDFITWAARTKNFCRHFHIPLQSGSNQVLLHMNRHYTREYFRDLVMYIKKEMPDAAIGVDVMAGFPTERQEDFELTLSLVSDLPVSYMHTFPYSSRPGTLAAAMKSKTSSREKTARARMLRKLSDAKKKAFIASQAGKVLPCLVIDRDKKTGCWKALSDNYININLTGTEGIRNMKNRAVNVRINAQGDGMASGVAV